MNYPSKGTCVPLICRESPDVGPDKEWHFKTGAVDTVRLIRTWDYLGRALVVVGSPTLLALWTPEHLSVCLSGAAYFRTKATPIRINKKFLSTSPDTE